MPANHWQRFAVDPGAGTVNSAMASPVAIDMRLYIELHLNLRLQVLAAWAVQWLLPLSPSSASTLPALPGPGDRWDG